MELNWQLAQQKAEFFKIIRHFFSEKKVIEVDVPCLSAATVTDLHLDAFSTQFNYDQSGQPKTFYLQTSPEFALKRLLAKGYGDIYSLAKAFRHEAAGNFHNPEFMMLEWYRLGFDDQQLMTEVDQLLQLILSTNQAERFSYQAIFIEQLSIDPLQTNCTELLEVLTSHNKYSDWLKNESKDTLLQVCFSELIEPLIGQKNPCFIYDFPASQASLARLDINDARVAKRFECFYQGIELANGFYELNNANQQRTRFELDNKLRKEANLPEKPIDERFLVALADLPDCSGVALGVDRLMMLALKQSSIKAVLTFDINNA